MANFLKDVQEALGGEKVAALVIGQYPGFDDDEALSRSPKELLGVVLPWTPEIERLFDYEYDDGFGGHECHPVIIWTATRVIISGCYDGSTWLTSVPRNPKPYMPSFIGG